jgi:DNA-binding transcriptional ArsR family regulator
VTSDHGSRVFAALADPHRRRLLERLTRGPRPVHALARDAGISRSAVSQHLALLRRVGLVQAERRGREVLYARSESGFVPAHEWLANFRAVQLSRIVSRGEVPLHISAVAIPVTDHDLARAFYVDVLGFEVVTDRTVSGWRWISLLPPTGSCALGLVRAPSAGVWTGVSLLTADLDELFQRWTARGVRFDGPPTPQAWDTRTTIFADIDGNRFQLVEVPR